MTNDQENPTSASEITPDTFPKEKAVSPFLGMPDYLKDPANYEKIQLALYDAGGSTCGHTELIEWSACNKCQRKQHDRAELMRKLGFASGAQYLAWKKVHDTIREKVPLAKYNSA